AAAARAAPAGRGDQHGRRRAAGSARRTPDVVRAAGHVLRRRDAGLGGADGRLPAYRLLREWLVGRTWCGALVAAPVGPLSPRPSSRRTGFRRGSLVASDRCRISRARASRPAAPIAAPAIG